jgi:hypothetical protein
MSVYFFIEFYVTRFTYSRHLWLAYFCKIITNLLRTFFTEKQKLNILNVTLTITIHLQKKFEKNICFKVTKMSFNEECQIKEEFDIKGEFDIKEDFDIKEEFDPIETLNEMENNRELTIKKEIVEEASVLGTSTAFLDIVQIKCEPEMPSFSEVSSDDQDSQSLRNHHKRRRKVKMSKIKKSKFFLPETLSREDGLMSVGKLVSKKQVRSYKRNCVNGYNFNCLNLVRLG